MRDHALRQLTSFQSLAPGSQREKIEVHTEAARNAHEQIVAQIEASGG